MCFDSNTTIDQKVIESKPFAGLNTMKLFQVYQKAVSFLIVRDKREAFVAKTIRQASHFILKIAPPVFSLGYAIGFTSIFMLFEAETFQQYCETFYPFITSAVNMCGLAVTFLKRKKVFQLIRDFEDIIETRKHILLVESKIKLLL